MLGIHRALGTVNMFIFIFCFFMLMMISLRAELRRLRQALTIA